MHVTDLWSREVSMLQCKVTYVDMLHFPVLQPSPSYTGAPGTCHFGVASPSTWPCSWTCLWPSFTHWKVVSVEVSIFSVFVLPVKKRDYTLFLWFYFICKIVACSCIHADPTCSQGSLIRCSCRGTNNKSNGVVQLAMVHCGTHLALNSIAKVKYGSW